MSHIISDTCVGCGACKRVCPEDAITGVPKGLHLINPKLCIDCGACGIVCPVSCISNQFGAPYAFLKPKERPKASVDQSACTGCQYCTDICPFECLEIRFQPGNGFASATATNAHPNKCVACKLCVLVCPREAIAVVSLSEGGREVA